MSKSRSLPRGLFSEALAGPPPPVSLCVLYDDNLRSRHIRRINRALADAIERFAEFELAFETTATGAISLPESISSNLVLRWKRQFAKGGKRGDITILFTGKNYGIPEDDSDVWGMWVPYESWILINAVKWRKRRKLARIIQHELGHAFGAVHVESEKSVMSRASAGEIVWDAHNRRIIHRNRNKYR